MPTITLTGIEKSYVAGTKAVRHLDLEVPDGSFMCLLGPSGCGKTTTLRMIAGLEQPTAGEIRVGDRVIDSVSKGKFVPTEKREMGFVFQSYALWPHLTVSRNVDFGLRLRKVPRAEREQRVHQAMSALHIEQLADRYPAQLSGGQQQRVSLARMLAVGPEVLLLDEPLSNLDAALRLEMRAELKRLHSRFSHTVVFVTHDQLEAMTMATHIAVMSEGLLQQVGPPLEIYNRPANTFVAEFVGSPPMNMLAMDEPSTADDALRDTALRDTALRDSALRDTALRDTVVSIDPAQAGDIGTVGIRPEAVHLVADASQAPASAYVFDATVGTVLPTGSSWVISLARAGADEMYAVAYTDIGVGQGRPVTGWVAPADLHLFDGSGLRNTGWDDAVSARAQAGARS